MGNCNAICCQRKMAPECEIISSISPRRSMFSHRPTGVVVDDDMPNPGNGVGGNNANNNGPCNGIMYGKRRNGKARMVRLKFKAPKSKPSYSNLRGSRDLRLHVAARLGQSEKMISLLTAGANPNAQDRTLYTPLMWAVYEGRQDIIRILLKAKCDVDKVSISGRTALHIAAAEGKEELVKILLAAEANANIQDSNLSTPLVGSIRRCGPRKQDVRLNKVNRFERAGYHLESVHALLVAGADAEVCDENLMTPLLWAVEKHRLDIAKCLITYKVNVNVCDGRGCTPLHYLASCDFSYEFAECLMRAGGDPTIRNADGVTPLIFAINWHNTAVAIALIQGNCDIDSPDRYNVSPIDLAARKGLVEVVGLLVVAGCDLTVVYDWVGSGASNNNIPVELKTDAVDWLRETVQSLPWSLKHLCRLTLRQTLQVPLATKVETLPLPTLMKNYIMLRC